MAHNRISDKHHSDQLTNDAYLQFNNGYYIRALNTINLAITKNPDNFLAYHLRGVIYANNNNFELAAQDYHAALNKTVTYSPEWQLVLQAIKGLLLEVQMSQTMTPDEKKKIASVFSSLSEEVETMKIEKNVLAKLNEKIQTISTSTTSRINQFLGVPVSPIPIQNAETQVQINLTEASSFKVPEPITRERRNRKPSFEAQVTKEDNMEIDNIMKPKNQ